MYQIVGRLEALVTVVTIEFLPYVSLTLLIIFSAMARSVLKMLPNGGFLFKESFTWEAVIHGFRRFENLEVTVDGVGDIHRCV